jgi:hypothetical protein
VAHGTGTITARSANTTACRQKRLSALTPRATLRELETRGAPAPVATRVPGEARTQAVPAVPRLGKAEPLARAEPAETVAPPRAAAAAERAVCPDRRPGAPLELPPAVPRARTAALLGLPPHQAAAAADRIVARPPRTAAAMAVAAD